MNNQTLEKANKWSADKYGFTVGRNPYDNLDTQLYYRPVRLEKQAYGHVWTILDPRCREIIREQLGISTISNHAQAIDSDDVFYWAENAKYSGNGKTIEEAECACIIVIMESTE